MNTLFKTRVPYYIIHTCLLGCEYHEKKEDFRGADPTNEVLVW